MQVSIHFSYHSLKILVLKTFSIARKVKILIENVRNSGDNSWECLFNTVTNLTRPPLIFGVIYFFKVDSGISTELRDGKRKIWGLYVWALYCINSKWIMICSIFCSAELFHKTWRWIYTCTKIYFTGLSLAELKINTLEDCHLP